MWEPHFLPLISTSPPLTRSGIPLALQNKAIRSGVPIGPFQTKRKRKSLRHSLDSTGGGAGALSNQSLALAGRARKQARVASVTGGGTITAMAAATATKKGDLEVRKDLTIESQRTEMIFFPTTSDSTTTTPTTTSGSRPAATSSVIITRAKVHAASRCVKDLRGQDFTKTQSGTSYED